MLLALYITFAVYSLTFFLRLLIPAEQTGGYACDGNGRPLRYRLNGFRVICVLLAGVAFRPDVLFVLHRERMGILAACFAFSLVASVYFFFFGPRDPPGERCATADGSAAISARDERNVLQHFYCGLAWNPRINGVDVKMALYACGASMQILLTLAGAVVQPSVANTTFSAMSIYFALEYLLWENVHLYTYDLFAERIGFKLCFGCLFFWPAFYPIGQFALFGGGNDIDAAQAAPILAIFLLGHVLTRGANMQKHLAKTGEAYLLIDRVPNARKTLPGTRVLIGAWWGVARHVNYTGEIIQSFAMAVPGYLYSGSLLPFLYPLYYIALFIPRELHDESVCEKKYGEVTWRKYKQLVPYRFIPGVV